MRVFSHSRDGRPLAFPVRAETRIDGKLGTSEGEAPRLELRQLNSKPRLFRKEAGFFYGWHNLRNRRRPERQEPPGRGTGAGVRRASRLYRYRHGRGGRDVG